MEDDVAKILIQSGCYINATKTNENTIKTPNGDDVIAYLSCRLAISNVKVRDEIEKNLYKK